ncbi:hypothetical protein O6H91_02G019000 [Diphasiastrum complanatum]|uniref:Uncharacterized protein n=1 Tax=Diphasiastrum complanatum TaxID=34168 RepID=A0ACC2EDD0_DIPCM|nr:hypothetical protein O6H91_02G019000 [Diphasiastrum complanatum]
MAFAAAAGRGAWAEIAVGTLEQQFEKAHNDLLFVQQRLEEEFDKNYSHDVNPANLLLRIKKSTKQLLSLEGECKKSLIVKQEFIEKTASMVASNRDLIRHMQTMAGLPVTHSEEDFAYSAVQTMINEWNSSIVV